MQTDLELRATIPALSSHFLYGFTSLKEKATLEDLETLRAAISPHKGATFAFCVLQGNPTRHSMCGPEVTWQGLCSSQVLLPTAWHTVA